ncbi:MAG: uracil-DNA glycosylase [Candidatus Woesearchaeota archaeon]
MDFGEKQRLLAELSEKILSTLHDELRENAQNLVFGRGNEDADIMFIGEAPGQKEDETGLPFVGSAGKRLQELLQYIELDIDDIYIANILKYRPPKNRNPTMKEIQEHTPFLLEQIQIISPKILVPLGNFATKFVLAQFLDKDMTDIDGISHIHGQTYVSEFEKKVITIIPQYHPAAMLYNPRLRSVIKEDFEKMRLVLESNT